ncbi:hypothetical protein GBF38_008520, partial [Nibea albiflora]
FDCYSFNYAIFVPLSFFYESLMFYLTGE